MELLANVDQHTHQVRRLVGLCLEVGFVAVAEFSALQGLLDRVAADPPAHRPQLPFDRAAVRDTVLACCLRRQCIEVLRSRLTLWPGEKVRHDEMQDRVGNLARPAALVSLS